MPAIKLQIKSLLMYGAMGTMLAYYTYIVFVVAFTLVYGFGSGSDWLVSLQLAITTITTYLIISDDTTIVDQIVSSFIYHDYNKCITDNRQMIINVDSNRTYQVTMQETFNSTKP